MWQDSTSKAQGNAPGRRHTKRTAQACQVQQGKNLTHAQDEALAPALGLIFNLFHLRNKAISQSYAKIAHRLGCLHIELMIGTLAEMDDGVEVLESVCKVLNVVPGSGVRHSVALLLAALPFAF